MDNKRELSNTKESSTGIEIRQWKNGSTSLRIHFIYRGIRCRESLNMAATPKNIKFATNLRCEIMSAIARGTFKYPEYFPNSPQAQKFGCKPPNNITVGTMLEKYLEEAKQTLELSTYDGYYKKTHRYLIPAFKDIPIRELTPAMVREWVKDFRLTMKTIQNALTPLRAIIATALVDEIIDKNPLDHIVLAKLINKETKNSDYEVDPFDRKEIELILNTAEGQVKNFFQFAFFTGMRTSELIALQWNDIDWINQQVHVIRAFVSGQIKKTKTQSGKRQILLLPPALAALEAQKKYTLKEGKHIFHTPFSNQPWSSPFQIRHEAWIKLLNRACVRYRNPYQTRHTYASMMLSNGENIMWVAKQMGHANIEMIIKTYGKWIPDSSITSGYKPVNDWSKHIALKETKCPVRVPREEKETILEEKIYENQRVKLASPRGFEPLLLP